MNDLDVMRTMRADAPIPSRQRLDAGEKRLIAAIDEPGARRAVQTRRRFGGFRIMLLAGGVAAAAGIAIVATQAGVSPVTVHGTPAAEAAKYSDPLVERATFGWLPRGMHANGYVADHQNEKFFQVIAQEGAKSGASVTLTAYERGKEPFLGYLPGKVPAKRIPAASINGHSAYWIYKPSPSGQSSFELRWQYAPNSWADLQGDELRGSSAELTRTAYRIAKSAKFGDNRPIEMPLHIGGVPGGLSPDRTVLNNGAHGELGAIVGYNSGGPSSDLQISIDKSNGTIGTAVPGGPGKAMKGLPRPNTKLKGHPAYRTPSLLYVYGDNGFDVEITASGAVLAKLNKTGGVVGLYQRMTVLGTDPASWTPNPIN
ncbi:hypothetical protein GCM10029978_005070 [Actinoallomurus acanthiterrae]